MQMTTFLKWLNELGWDVWVQKAGANVEALRQLVEISKESCLHSPVPETDLHHRLEIGILYIHQVLIGYLQDTNKFVNEKRGNLRAEVTVGCVQTRVLKLDIQFTID